MATGAFEIDPIRDPRWTAFVKGHPRASVFHGVPWLRSLHKTYGYEPLAFTTSAPSSPLRNAWVFCAVNSWLTGSRLVSLPFSDHCEPLCDSSEELEVLTAHVQSALAARGWKYAEIRPINVDFSRVLTGFSAVGKYYLHTLNLHPDSETLLRSFDKNCIQRRIRRAQSANLIEKCGNSDDLLRDFYCLFSLTRQRHQLPPTPYTWFVNLRDSQDKDLEIRLAYKDQAPMAAIIILHFRDVAYYKYGCSDVRFNKFGAIPWLMWHAISTAKSNDSRFFDFGRTDVDSLGLLRFKEHWVHNPKQLTYWELSQDSCSLHPARDWKLKMAKRVFSHLPNSMLTATGKLLYRHFG